MFSWLMMESLNLDRSFAVGLIKIFFSRKILVFMDVTWVSFENGYCFVFDCLLLRVPMLNVVENCVFVAFCTCCSGWNLCIGFGLETVAMDLIQKRLMNCGGSSILLWALQSGKWVFCHPYFSILFL